MRTERGKLSGFGENANEPEIKVFMPSEVEQSYPRVRQIGIFSRHCAESIALAFRDVGISLARNVDAEFGAMPAVGPRKRLGQLERRVRALFIEVVIRIRKQSARQPSVLRLPDNWC
jgi:hypothetical protein